MGWEDGQACLEAGWLTFGRPESLGEQSAESFAQCWLVFGLLHVLFGDDLCEDKFVDASSVGDKVVQTRDLLAMARKMVERDKEGHNLGID